MSKALGDLGGAAKFGIFQNVHINPFPVRAAIDIGTGGMISMTVGRVDAANNAVRDFMYQTQLPLQLMSANAALSFPSSSSSFILSEDTRNEIRNKMRLLYGALRRDQYDGLSERAAVISWPLCESADSLSLAEELTREFKVDVRVLGKTFHVDMPFFGSTSLLQSKGEVSSSQRRGKKSAVVHKRNNDDDDDSDNSLQVLMRRVLRRREERRQRLQSREAEEGHCRVDDDKHCVVSPEEQLKQLAFLAHAATSKCIAPERMLVLTEDSQRGLCILGMDTTGDEDINEDSTALVAAHSTRETSGVLLHVLPVDISAAHHILLTAVQRRLVPEVNNGERRSPNPVLCEEFQRLRILLEEMIRPTLPVWVERKSSTGSVICGSSYNGGALNIAARVAQQTNVTLDHLETHAKMHYCGLTDVLLAVNYPDPMNVLPGAAITSALMHAIDTNRFEYLPEVSIPAALLTQPSLWIYSKGERVRAILQKKSFFRGGSLRRTFCRPHTRENPTAPPGASWQHNKSWNPLSYESSTGVIFLYQRQGVSTSATLKAFGGTRWKPMTSKDSGNDTEDDDDDEKEDGLLNEQEDTTSLRRRRVRRGDGRGDDGPNDCSTGSRQRLSRLQKKKQREREREERRQAMEEVADSRRSKQEAERQRQEELEHEEEERCIAEEKALAELRAEKKRQDDEEYAKWAGAIGVEERGELGDEERTRHNSLRAFLTERSREVDARHKKSQVEQECQQFVPTTKTDDDDDGVKNILVLSDVAREHGVSVEVLVNLMGKLLEEGIISGVFDDRGKFVFVAEAHYVRLALFIQQRGRVSVKELVRECNRVILS